MSLVENTPALSVNFDEDYFFEDFDYAVIDAKYPLNQWTHTENWRGRVESMEVYAYEEGGKRKYKTRRVKSGGGKPEPQPEPAGPSESEKKKKFVVRKKGDPEPEKSDSLEKMGRKIFEESVAIYPFDTISMGTNDQYMMKKAIQTLWNEPDYFYAQNALQNLSHEYSVVSGQILSDVQYNLPEIYDVADISENKINEHKTRIAELEKIINERREWDYPDPANYVQPEEENEFWKLKNLVSNYEASNYVVKGIKENIKKLNLLDAMLTVGYDRLSSLRASNRDTGPVDTDHPAYRLAAHSNFSAISNNEDIKNDLGFSREFKMDDIRRNVKEVLHDSMEALLRLPEEAISAISISTQDNKIYWLPQSNIYKSPVYKKITGVEPGEKSSASGCYNLSRGGQIIKGDLLANNYWQETILIHESAHAMDFEHFKVSFSEGRVKMLRKYLRRKMPKILEDAPVSFMWTWQKYKKKELRAYGHERPEEGFAVMMEELLHNPLMAAEKMPHFYAWAVKHVWKGNEKLLHRSIASFNAVSYDPHVDPWLKSIRDEKNNA